MNICMHAYVPPADVHENLMVDCGYDGFWVDPYAAGHLPLEYCGRTSLSTTVMGDDDVYDFKPCSVAYNI